MRGIKNAESTKAVREEVTQVANQNPDEGSGQKDGKAEKVKTVKMVRDDGKTADVHPDEVANYALGGYKKV